MEKNIKKNTKEVTWLKFRFASLVFVVDLIAIIIIYFVMPIIQNFPPLTEDFAFQREVQQFTHIQQYTVVFILGITMHLGSFSIMMKNIYSYMNKYFRKEKISYKEILTVRSDCINIPYKVFIVQMIMFVVVGILFNFIMLAKFLAILKFTLVIISMASLISILLLLATQKFFEGIMITTYNVTDKYDRNVGMRIPNHRKLLFQMVPFMLMLFIIISLIGYSKAVEQEGFSYANYYRAYLDSKDIQNSSVNMESLKQILDTIPLNNESDYYFIITPGDKEIYVSKEDGYVGDFALAYRDFFFEQSDGMLYEKFGIDEQLYALKLTDINNEVWYVGFKFAVIDMNLFIYFLSLMIFVLLAYSVLLYIWAKNVSNDVLKISNSLKDIVENVDTGKTLPITSNDEFGDLAYYYNKIQELTAANIDKIRENQDMLMEKERLASLGQLIGGIAHNLKTPIMSISGAAEGLKDLVTEYDSSIGDPEVTNADHHDIAKDMSEWIVKIKTHTEYMSDVITAVKGQAVALSNTDDMTFTVSELIKQVNILMKHELKNALIYLNIQCDVSERLEIHGNINSLVQVINNMISNAIQAYAGEPNKNIDFIISKQENNVVFSIRDYGPGLPDGVKDKLFKEMITTKGKNGTGLGLFMSYSNIRAHFNGNITVESEQGNGTTFNIIIPLEQEV